MTGLKEDLFINNRTFVMQDDLEVIHPKTAEIFNRHFILVRNSHAQFQIQHISDTDSADSRVSLASSSDSSKNFPIPISACHFKDVLMGNSHFWP